MNPDLKLAIAGGLVVVAVAFSLIMFPKLSDQVDDIRVTQTQTAVAGTPTAAPVPLATTPTP